MKMIEIAGRQVEIPEMDLAPVVREALITRPELTVSQWAEKYRYLNKGANPGPWRNDKAPYLKGIMDLPDKPGVFRTVIMKHVQGGISEAFRNYIMAHAEIDTDPIGLVLPDKAKGRQIITDDVIPAFETTPIIRQLFTSKSRDVKSEQIKLSNGFGLSLMWSNSPSSLASNPYAKVLEDEVDKYPVLVKSETAPHLLAEKRLTTYGDRARSIAWSTPTTPLGYVARLYEESTLFLFCIVQCPHCGAWHRLIWENVRWDERAKSVSTAAEYSRQILDTGGCWLVCPSCGGMIHEDQRRRIVKACKWGTVDQNTQISDGVITDAEAVSSFPKRTKLGLHISGLYSLFNDLDVAVANYIEAREDPIRLQDHVNAFEGLPYRVRTAENDMNTFEQKVKAARLPQAVLPWWTHKIVASVDTQMDHLYVSVRAWGPQMISARIWHGIIRRPEKPDEQTPDEFAVLEREVLNRTFAYEDGWKALPPRFVDLMVIDSGGTDYEDEVGLKASRTQDVYAFCLRHQNRVIPIKGERQQAQIWKHGRANTAAGLDLTLYLIDVTQYQDILSRFIGGKIETRIQGHSVKADRWQLDRTSDGVYAQQMCNLIRIIERDGTKQVEFWAPISSTARVDYRDAEGYSVFGAYVLGINRIGELGPYHDQLKQDIARAEQSPEDRRPDHLHMMGQEITYPDGRKLIYEHQEP